jgi:hypothetical protein
MRDIDKRTDTRKLLAAFRNFANAFVIIRSAFFMRFRKIAKSDLISSYLSVRPSAKKNLAHTGQILMKFDI